MNTIKQFDYFRKVRQDVTLQKSPSGGILSICMLVLLCFLILGNFYILIFPEKSRQAIIEQNSDFHGKMLINFNITLDKMPCAAVQVDMQDVMGSNIQDYEDTIYKSRISKFKKQEQIITTVSQPVRYKNNSQCGSCYGAELQPNQCCNTCDEVIYAYQKRNWKNPIKQEVEQCQNFASFLDKNGELYLTADQIENKDFQLIIPLQKTGDLSYGTQVNVYIKYKNELNSSFEEQIGGVVFHKSIDIYNISVKFKQQLDEKIEVQFNSADIMRKYEVIPLEGKLFDLILKGEFVKDQQQSYSIYQAQSSHLLQFNQLDDQFGSEHNQITFITGNDWFNMEKQLGEGCNINGFIKVFKVPGNFHISMHGKGLITFLFGSSIESDAGHTIHNFYITDEDNPNTVIMPVKTLQNLQQQNQMTYQYYLKITKAINVNILGESHFYEVFSTYQSQSTGMPAIYFRYDIEPITMKYTTKMDSLGSFLVSLCAVIGGTFALTSFISLVLLKLNKNL